jgi:hypothetical protein
MGDPTGSLCTHQHHSQGCWASQTSSLPDQFGDRNFIKTLTFTDDQVVRADDENTMHRILYKLCKITIAMTSRYL